MFEAGDFQEMMAALPSCVLVHDAATKAILWANPAACAALGFTLQELLPLKAPDMSSHAEPYRREIGLRWLQGAVERGINVVDWCYRTRHGEDILSEAVATLVHLAGRDVVMVQFRDIGREEQVKREKKRLESRLKEFMHGSDEGLAVLEPDGTIAFVNATGRSLLGMHDDPLPRFTALLTPATRGELERLLATADREAGPVTLAYELDGPGQAGRWHRARCRYIEIEDDLKGHLLHFRDITAEVEADRARRHQQDALEYLARNNAMGEMAAAIAHELSQPLAAIRNYLQGSILRLRDPQSAPEGIVFGLESAGRQVDHASAIIKSVREYVVRLEQAEAPADLNAILAEARYFIALKANEAEVDVEFVQCPEALPVSCEKVLVGQVILNLAFNAIEEMQRWPRAARRVRIATSRRDGQAVLCVRDHGAGIDALLHERLFDGFFTSKVGGNGIGLALCKNIIGRHRGDIWAQPGIDGGTLFCFALPLLPAAPGGALAGLPTV